jgi:hypothetical protein
VNKPFGTNSKEHIIREESAYWKDMIDSNIKDDPTGVTYQYIMFLREAYLDMLCNSLEELDIDTPVKAKKIQLLMQDYYNRDMKYLFQEMRDFHTRVTHIEKLG